MLDLWLAKEREELREHLRAFVDERILPIGHGNYVNRPGYLLVFAKIDLEISHEGVNIFVLNEGMEVWSTSKPGSYRTSSGCGRALRVRSLQHMRVPLRRQRRVAEPRRHWVLS